ncbi:MAG: response regulator transcription factor [Planctomycetota bacterium]
MRILVVEDDDKIASFVARALRESGHAVDVATTGTEGLDLGRTGVYDAAVVDVMLPGLDGFGVIEKLRAAQVQTPVLFLSARHSVDDRIRGLRAGGDDYVTKPFSVAEVVARVEALIRRATRSAEPTTLSCGDLHADLLTREVRRGDRRIDLQPREFALLELMLRNRGRVLGRTAILEHVYDYRFDPQTNVVDVLVSRLRSKIDRDFDKKMIRTVRGVGYVLDA